MLRICVLKSTGRIIEMQSLAIEGTLIKNNMQYYSESNLEEQLVTEQEYKDRMTAQEPKLVDEKVEFSKLLTTDAKIDFIAKRLSLK